MKLIPLREFRRVTGLADSALVELLERNALTCSFDPHRGLLVDISDISNTKLVEKLISLREAAAEEERSLLVEKAAKVIRSELDTILDEALVLMQGGS